jgi:hypothetical protein
MIGEGGIATSAESITTPARCARGSPPSDRGYPAQRHPSKPSPRPFLRPLLESGAASRRILLCAGDVDPRFPGERALSSADMSTRMGVDHRSAEAECFTPQFLAPLAAQRLHSTFFLSRTRGVP